MKDVRPYDLRKAFASRLVASGADLKTIMSITGHTQINVLMKHYAHVIDVSRRRSWTGCLGERGTHKRYPSSEIVGENQGGDEVAERARFEPLL